MILYGIIYEKKITQDKNLDIMESR